MTKSEPLKECGDCRFWKPLNSSHLCLEGKCVLIQEYPVARTRNDSCEIDFEPIDERGGE
ncbi:MAG TPA: hypothetical protein ENH85_14490 [Candidatus Scalindua sp.]|nr:hypothetical protein [Candidatus Scalindua sp.]